MGRKEDVNGIRGTVSNLQDRVSNLQEKASVTDSESKNDSVHKDLRIVLMGPPGSGKPVQATKMKEKFCVCHLQIGEMLRSQISKKGPIAKYAREIMEHGHLVTDETIIDLVSSELDSNKDCRDGFILDDFPRTITEARLLDQMLAARNQPLHRAIELNVTDDNLLETRITGRLTHLASGRSYHTIFHPPKEYMKDDITGEPLVHRPDDSAKELRQRLSTYRERIGPIAEYYKKKGIWKEVDGSQELMPVFNSILSAVGRESMPDRG